MSQLSREKERSEINPPSWGLHALGLLSLVSYGILAWKGRETGESLDLNIFYLLLTIPWLSLLFLFFKKGLKVSLRSIIFWAVLFRLAGILALPTYEDDYFRFLWDGYRFAESGDPYTGTPFDFFGDPDVPEKLNEVLGQINHPDYPTLYGPPLEVVFLMSWYLWPAKLWGLKILFVLAEAMMLFALFKITSRKQFLFAAWCPLMVFETSFQAHPDIIGVAFLTFALVSMTQGKSYRSALFLGWAIASKIFAILAVPFALKWKNWPLQSAILAGVMSLLYLPFLLQGSNAGWTSTSAMAGDWEFNAAGYSLLRSALPSQFARLAALTLFALCYGTLVIWFWWKQYRKDPVPAPLDVVYACFFLFSPVINPWYLLWMVPFVVIRPKCWSITALAVVSLSYMTGLNLQRDDLENFSIPLAVKGIEFGSIMLALLWDIKNSHIQKKHFKKRNTTADPHSHM